MGHLVIHPFHCRNALLSQDLRKLSIADIRGGGKLLILMKALTSKPKCIVASGVCLGIGVSASQYLALASLRCEATAHFNPFVIVASVVMSMAGSWFMIWVLFRFLQVG